MLGRSTILALAATALATCGTIGRLPAVTVRAEMPLEDVQRIRERCQTVSECMSSKFGWQTPAALSVTVVPRLRDYVPEASEYAEGYSHRATAIIIIEASAWAKTPETLSHEMAHLAVPEDLDYIDGPLREGLCNLAAMACAQSTAESDRLRVQSLIAVLNATGGIAFDVTWQTVSGGHEHAAVSFDPGAGAYLSHAAEDTREPDPDAMVPRTRAMVTTFVLWSLARERGDGAVVQALLDLDSVTGPGFAELELARHCGIRSSDDLRHAAVREVDRHDLAEIVRHEARWLYPRLKALGLDLRPAAANEKPTGSIRISLQGSDVVVMPSDLHRAPSAPPKSPIPGG